LKAGCRITLPVWSASMVARHFRRPRWPKFRMSILHVSKS
jgi:hypothetical protein